jgi:hypothetical protein
MSFSVMPDLFRHPEGFEKTGFRLSPERRLSLSRAIYGQTLFRVDKASKQGYIEMKLLEVFWS